jgi:hypothetical protein
MGTRRQLLEVTKHLVDLLAGQVERLSLTRGKRTASPELAVEYTPEAGATA